MLILTHSDMHLQKFQQIQSFFFLVFIHSEIMLETYFTLCLTYIRCLSELIM